MDPFYDAPSASGSPPDPPEGEVRAVSFSPDGLLLAVARSDDQLHVYDSRFMGSREPMGRFLHWGEDCCLGRDRWGIVDAVWVDGWCGRGLGVVTGGSDGEMSHHRLTRSLAHIFLPSLHERLRPLLGRTQIERRYFERRGACATQF